MFAFSPGVDKKQDKVIVWTLAANIDIVRTSYQSGATIMILKPL
jgi:hypothetical protein